MDPIVWIFLRLNISERKYWYFYWLFHAYFNPLHRLVSDFYKAGKRRPQIKSINTSPEFDFANYPVADLPNPILFKCKHNRIWATCLFDFNGYCNSVYSSNSHKITLKPWFNRQSCKSLFIIGNMVLVTCSVLHIRKPGKTIVCKFGFSAAYFHPVNHIFHNKHNYRFVIVRKNQFYIFRICKPDHDNISQKFTISIGHCNKFLSRTWTNINCTCYRSFNRTSGFVYCFQIYIMG